MKSFSTIFTQIIVLMMIEITLVFSQTICNSDVQVLTDNLDIANCFSNSFNSLRIIDSSDPNIVTNLKQLIPEFCANQCTPDQLKTASDQYSATCSGGGDYSYMNGVILLNSYDILHTSLCKDDCIISSFEGLNQNAQVSKDFTSKIAQSPPNVVCTDCIKALAKSLIDYQFNNPSTTFSGTLQNLKIALELKCGESFIV
ncbi:8153_t:CDS:2 [Funneliformis geosporum]|uniref:8153_t:CDS:1 n=1 Tax=Funneliformis geosporum TaxID=1117311 RepID=A0A9W4SG96_9GLOM|nr:8153_t:CDS:2 [Funneliformis geosporum]